MKHRREETSMSDVGKLIEDIRVLGWARPTIEVANEALVALQESGPGTFAVRAQLESLIKAAEYWENAQRKAFEDYLEIKATGWPDEFPSSGAPEGA
jgi:hypothetical protein